MLFKKLPAVVMALAASAAFHPTAQAQAPDNTIPVLIRFNEPPGQAQADLVSSHGGMVTRQFRIVPAVAARIPPRPPQRSAMPRESPLSNRTAL